METHVYNTKGEKGHTTINYNKALTKEATSQIIIKELGGPYLCTYALCIVCA